MIVDRREFLTLTAGATLATLTSCARRGAIDALPAAAKEEPQEPAPAEEAETPPEEPAEEKPQEEPAPDPLAPEEDSSGFVLLADAVPDAIQEIRYYTTFNFVGERIDGYEQPVALITREAGEALRKASDAAVARGYRLKIFDAYRPQMAVDHFVRWSQDLEDTRMKEYFYPDLDKATIFQRGYVASKSGHTRGSTVDLTLFDMRAEREADAGTTFDFFGERSHVSYLGVSDEQYNVRMTLRDIMEGAGFIPIDEEWWHFRLANEPYPDTYFTFPVSVSSLAQ